MAISTNQKPTIYRNLYENTRPGRLTGQDERTLHNTGNNLAGAAEQFATQFLTNAT